LSRTNFLPVFGIQRKGSRLQISTFTHTLFGSSVTRQSLSTGVVLLLLGVTMKTISATSGQSRALLMI
jgi:hypothetical protein